MVERKLNKEICLRVGGHCWVEIPFPINSTVPERICKHCNKLQFLTGTGIDSTGKKNFEWKDK